MSAYWNILLYTIAKNPDEHKRVTDAITNMHDALTTDQCNIAVQLHTSSNTTRHWISRGSKVQTEMFPVVLDAGEPSSLTSFLNAANRMFPARSSALVLWAHSSGLDHVHDYPQQNALRQPGHESVSGSHDQPRLNPGSLGPGAVGQRSRGRGQRNGLRRPPAPSPQQILTNVGIKQAIAASSRRHVDILGLNACWMASFEVEYELRSVSDVQIASQVYANPWPYGAIIAALSATPDLPAEQLAKEIVASVRSEIQADKRSDAVSALSSGQAMEELATALDAYAKRIMILLESDWESVSKAVMEDAQRVDDPYQVDLMSLVHELGKYDLRAKIAAASVASKYRAMLLANAASAAHPGVHGLSLFCPKSTHVDLGDAYRGIDFRSNSWAQFLKAFQIKLARLSAA